MRIVLYSPYIPNHVGGGEAYLLRVATVLSAHHTVFVAVGGSKIDALAIRQKYESFTQLDLHAVTFITTPLGTKEKWWRKLWWTRQFDVLYYLTDGSLFFSLAKRNILHIQIPFTDKKTSLLDRLKLSNWQIKNTNSEFTRQVVTKAWQTPIQFVHHPAVDTNILAPLSAKKDRTILSVGRFFRQLHSKRQDILVQLFAELCQQQPSILKEWRLILVGSVEDESYATEVAEMAKGLPVTIIHDATRQELIKLYQESSIYWHATGFGVDPHVHPEKMEHFGISTVEAMAAGAVPVVYAQGGQPEILGDTLKEWGWHDLEHASNATLRLISDKGLFDSVSQQAVQRAQQFDGKRFREVLEEMIHE